MSDDPKLPAIPKYKDLVWIEDPAGAKLATYSERLRLHVVPGVMEKKQVFMSGVVELPDSAMQACAFYATDEEYAKQLAYQLAVLISPDFA